MPCPFPGIDPFIEAQGRWLDFHQTFLVVCRSELNRHLPENYVANLEEQVHLVRSSDEPLIPVRPDLVVIRPSGPLEPSGPLAAVRTLESTTIPLAWHDLEEVRELWIEIRCLPDMELVTVVELLSPSNKIGEERVEYLEKRAALLNRAVHIVELDLLLGGRRLPMLRPLPPAHAYAIVSRAEQRPDAQVYGWTLRDPLPTIPIPLENPDPDIPLRLAPAFAQTYQEGRYGKLIRYDQPIAFPLSDQNQAWVRTMTNC